MNLANPPDAPFQQFSTTPWPAAASRPAMPIPCSSTATCSTSASPPTRCGTASTTPRSPPTTSTATSTTPTSASTSAASAPSTAAPGDPEGYLLPFEEIGRKVEETLALNGTGILMQGGVHPDLPLSFYEDLLRYLQADYPDVPPPCLLAAGDQVHRPQGADELLRRHRAAQGGGADVDPRRRRRDPLGRHPQRGAGLPQVLGRGVDRRHAAGAPQRPAHLGDDDVRHGRDRSPRASSTSSASATSRTRPAASPPSSPGPSSTTTPTCRTCPRPTPRSTCGRSPCRGSSSTTSSTSRPAGSPRGRRSARPPSASAPTTWARS